GRGAIVDQNDLVAGQGQFVAAAGSGPIERRKELKAGVSAGVFDAVARFVGEFAKIHFPRVRRESKHVDVRAGAENTILSAINNDGTNFRMLEADALQRIMQLDVDAEVVGIELEFVSRSNTAVLRNVHGKRGNGTVEREPPMLVARRLGLEIDSLNLWLKF